MAIYLTPVCEDTASGLTPVCEDTASGLTVYEDMYICPLLSVRTQLVASSYL